MGERHDQRFRVMGSEAHVTVVDGPPDLLALARTRLHDLENRWSRFRADSDIGRLNRAGGSPVVVSAETYRVISDAIEAWHLTDGRFDPTVADTMERAGYDRPRDQGVGSGQAEHRPCPTPAGIVLDEYPGSVTLPAGVKLDLGGIGKGAAADLVAAELLAAGAAGCCVNVGGDLRLAGNPPRPEGWRVEVEPGPGVEAIVLGVAEGAVCTSTRTRRTWSTTLGPEHHLRHPDTGRPLRTGLTTVTVVGARAAQSEILTKAAFVVGSAGAGGIIGAAGATGLLVTDDGTVVELAGLAPFVAAGASVAVEAVAGAGLG